MTASTTEMVASTAESIRARMAEIREESATARANGDSRTAYALDGELTFLGQRLRNLRPAPVYSDDRCCTACR
ncbi:hypothetical protein [Streptomyces sp. MS2.AVA.5]|uniref:Uncharacterized protein n=1 Tax=Streptomyces achmelvichensis TaxID=3134111 RepID=A0ACC6Q8S1_9ACTN